MWREGANGVMAGGKKKKRFGPMVWDGIEIKKWPNIGLGIGLPLGPTWASKIGSIYI